MRELIERLRVLEQDHEPDGWPAVRMRDITALLDALDAAPMIARFAQACAREGGAVEPVAGPFWGYEFVRNDGIVLIERREAERRIDTLRAQLEAAENLVVAVEAQAEENFQEYVDANEARIDAEARAEAAEAEVARLRGINSDLCRIHNARLVDAAKSEARTKALEAEAERLRVDAERYRWLRQDAGLAGWHMPRRRVPCPDRIAGCLVAHAGGQLSGATLDAANDAARTKEAAP